jgi:hypothetical protein
MRKALVVLLTAISVSSYAQNEFFVGTDANSFVVKSGETVSVNGLVLLPTADFDLTNNKLTTATTVTHAAVNPYIPKVYQFQSTSNAFTGKIGFNYAGITIPGTITEANMILHYHNGAGSNGWQYVTPNTSLDVSGDYLVSGAITAGTLNEITLSDVARSLPVVWLNFTSENKNNKFVVLKWSTASEINTKDFLVQHSIDGISWNNIGTVAAKGNSASVSDYTLTHFAPVQGNNFYRLQQRDLDGKSSYSKILNEFLAGDIPTLSLYPNPVISSNVSIQSSKNLSAIIYSLTGKKIWNGTISAGVNKISVEGWAKGVYFVKTADQTLQFVIQ